MRRVSRVVVCVVFAAVIGCEGGPPATKVEYKTQHNLLQRAMGRLEHSERAHDVETLGLLRKLEKELAEAQERHLAAQREIARLKKEVAHLRRAAGFAVHRIEIQFFTHAAEKGIELGVTPYDRHDDVVKTAGAFNLSLHRRGVLGGLGRKITMWQFSARDVETLWTGELFQGYRMKLAWPGGKVPNVEVAILRVDFTTAEGTTYTDTRELEIGGVPR